MDTAEEGVVVNLFKALSNTDQRKMYRYFWNFTHSVMILMVALILFNSTQLM